MQRHSSPLPQRHFRTWGRVPTAFMLAALTALAGCSTAPLSFIEGTPVTRTDIDLSPVRVVSIDGELQLQSLTQAVGIAPGRRWLVLEAAPTKTSARLVQRSFVFKVEPCTRYFLAARRSNPMASEWDLVIDQREPVAGCNAAEELKKAGADAMPSLIAPGAAASEVIPAASAPAPVPR